MFVCNREAALDALRKLGRNACCYSGEWPANRCDCKYGGPTLRDPLKPLAYMSEQTGCPELRTFYAVVDGMTDEAWDDLLAEAGHVRSSFVAESARKEQPDA